MMPNPPSNFMKFADTDFEPYILPIIPSGAKLTANSTLNEEQLGKIPGEWVSGLGAWRGLQTGRIGGLGAAKRLSSVGKVGKPNALRP